MADGVDIDVSVRRAAVVAVFVGVRTFAGIGTDLIGAVVRC